MTHKEKASAIYKELQAMVDNMVRNDIASAREIIADAIKCKLADYSYERYAAGADFARESN